ncbi:aminoacyl-histidine dipeptidase [Streptococcus minor]|uniref:aminoacyl-histidine dipeptidase n=1 Tax=Streptococcus minor TaxID=229549 RepID=UPI00035E5DF5|nr:aminoacyl-histidine dipeptidase [Streptococcus minor]
MTLQIEPRVVFDWFYQINQIPRESGNEKAVSDFLVHFAKERQLDVEQDELWNVIIRKPASSGYEEAETVIIQGHMDMVCVKTEDSQHDFSQDPIEMQVDGNILRANGTTLGADNGIAVAMQLALLDGDYPHPALEILITTNEETTMAGAGAIQSRQLKGTQLLNIDGEEEGVFFSSCAGGTTISSSFALEKEVALGTGLCIRIDGLKGGHSGMEIHQGRANANILLFRILSAIQKKTDLRIASLTGGTRDNVIPSQALAGIWVEDEELARHAVEEIIQVLKKEFHTAEPSLSVSISPISLDVVYTKDLTERLITFFTLLPNGVQVMSQDISGLVQTSLNNAILFEKGDHLVLQTSLRSSMDSQLEELANQLKVLAELCGGTSSRKHDYPGWNFEPISPLRDRCLAVYKDVYDKPATYTAVHAGLECGFLKQSLPDCDMISYGPNIYDVHSTKEYLEIDSVARVWEFTKSLLASMR